MTVLMTLFVAEGAESFREFFRESFQLALRLSGALFRSSNSGSSMYPLSQPASIFQPIKFIVIPPFRERIGNFSPATYLFPILLVLLLISSGN